MKKLLLGIVLLVTSSFASAYDIGGAYATLIDCSWGSYGYQHGYIGTYKTSDGSMYNIFFGSSYCEY